MHTPASFAAFATEERICSSSAAGRPSSRISASESHFGSPPLMQMSFTVPQTASLPMSPPGKKRGLTTKLSVEKTSSSPPGTTAPSPSWRRAGLSSCGRISFSMSEAVFFPPLP